MASWLAITAGRPDWQMNEVKSESDRPPARLLDLSNGLGTSYKKRRRFCTKNCHVPSHDIGAGQMQPPSACIASTATNDLIVLERPQFGGQAICPWTWSCCEKCEMRNIVLADRGMSYLRFGERSVPLVQCDLSRADECMREQGGPIYQWQRKGR